MQEKPVKARVKTAFIQSLFVAGCMCVCFLLMNFALNGFVITGLAASSFIAFAFPEAQSSRPKYLIGGYVCGIAGGAGADLICDNVLALCISDVTIATVISCVIAVYIASVMMMSFNLQHPPAAAMASAVVIDNNPLWAAFVALACILLICLIKMFVMKYSGGNTRKDKTRAGSR